MVILTNQYTASSFNTENYFTDNSILSACQCSDWSDGRQHLLHHLGAPAVHHRCQDQGARVLCLGAVQHVHAGRCQSAEVPLLQERHGLGAIETICPQSSGSLSLYPRAQVHIDQSEYSNTRQNTLLTNENTVNHVKTLY